MRCDEKEVNKLMLINDKQSRIYVKKLHRFWVTCL
jgi:hypothetical protein